ncbi:MAG TPA: glycogen/starch synthase, partial [Ktedonobacterales bacterium]|nr:glycogen/starch synthase [Ktedonobacterales bacterium]
MTHQAADETAGEPSLNVLMLATEAVPFAKEGGVADVLGSLPKELTALGHDVRIAIPRYGTIDPARWSFAPTGVTRTFPMFGGLQTVGIWRGALPDAPVTAYLLEHEALFARHQRLYL